MFNVVSVTEILDGVENYKNQYNKYLNSGNKNKEKEIAIIESGLFCLIAIGDLKNYIYFEIIKINKDIDWDKNLDIKIDMENLENCLKVLKEAEESVLKILNCFGKENFKPEEMQ